MANSAHIIYEIFSLVIGVIGTGTGAFLLSKLRKNKANRRNVNDRMLFAIILTMAICDLWLGGTYLFIGTGTIDPTSEIAVGMLVRPALPLVILLPAILVQKLGI